MGFLNFYKRNKKNNNVQPLPKLDIKNTELPDVGVCSDYNSPIADSFMVGSSISDITQSSLSEEIFNELPLSGKSGYYTPSSSSASDYSEVTISKNIRHSLTLKQNCTPPSVQDKKVWRQSNISTLHDSVLSTISKYQYLYDNSIEIGVDTSSGNNATPKNNNTKKRNSIKPDLFINTKLPPSDMNTIVAGSPKSQNNSTRHLNRINTERASSIAPTTTAQYTQLSKIIPKGQLPKATSPTSPTHQEFAIDRMKERHRQEYRRSMQWSPTTSESGTLSQRSLNSNNNTFISRHQNRNQPASIKQSLVPFINKKNQITPTYVILGNASVTNNQCYGNTKQMTSLDPIQEQCYSLQTFAVPVSMRVMNQQPQINQHQHKQKNHDDYKNNSGTFGFSAQRSSSLRSDQCNRARGPILPRNFQEENALFTAKGVHLNLQSRNPTTITQKKSMSVPNITQLLDEDHANKLVENKQVKIHHERPRCCKKASDQCAREKVSSCSHHQSHYTMIKRNHRNAYHCQSRCCIKEVSACCVEQKRQSICCAY